MKNWFKLVLWIASVCVAAVVGLVIFYLGPSLHMGGKEQLLAKCVLADKSTVVLIQTPNRTIIEPYTVRLYRVYPDGKAEVCLVGFEESHWWFAGLKSRDEHKIDIICFGSSECVYDLRTKRLRWNDNSYPPQESQPFDLARISKTTAQLIVTP